MFGMRYRALQPSPSASGNALYGLNFGRVSALSLDSTWHFPKDADTMLEGPIISVPKCEE